LDGRRHPRSVYNRGGGKKRKPSRTSTRPFRLLVSRDIEKSPRPRPQCSIHRKEKKGERDPILFGPCGQKKERRTVVSTLTKHRRKKKKRCSCSCFTSCGRKGIRFHRILSPGPEGRWRARISCYQIGAKGDVVRRFFFK